MKVVVSIDTVFISTSIMHSSLLNKSRNLARDVVNEFYHFWDLNLFCRFASSTLYVCKLCYFNYGKKKNEM